MGVPLEFERVRHLRAAAAVYEQTVAGVDVGHVAPAVRTPASRRARASFRKGAQTSPRPTPFQCRSSSRILAVRNRISRLFGASGLGSDAASDRFESQLFDDTVRHFVARSLLAGDQEYDLFGLPLGVPPSRRCFHQMPLDTFCQVRRSSPRQRRSRADRLRSRAIFTVALLRVVVVRSRSRAHPGLRASTGSRSARVRSILLRMC